MKRNFFGILVVFLVLSAAMVGCFGGGNSAEDTGSEQSDSGQTSDSDSSSAPEGSDIVLEPSTGDQVEDPAGEVVPDDVPIIPGAYNLDVIRSGTQVNFTVDGDVESVMNWYQGELDTKGWLPTRAPDSAMGAIGAMSRENANGDILALNLSYNQNGGFVIIQIAISRVNP